MVHKIAQVEIEFHHRSDQDGDAILRQHLEEMLTSMRTKPLIDHPQYRMQTDLVQSNITEDELQALAAKLTPAELYKVLLAMIDARMDATSRTVEKGLELTALADACVAYEAVAFPTQEETDGAHCS